MCGLCGIWGVVDENLTPLTQLMEKLAHRGPDGRGLWHQGAVAVGHTRLSIIDLTTGQQPLPNEGGTLTVVLNGEIYNHGALRHELEARGHRFRSRGDAEVLVHGFEEEGPAFVQRLRGMFAFALSDGARLLLARDPLGIKPLYYGWRDGRLYFASELKALFGAVDQAYLVPPGHFLWLAGAALPGRALPTQAYIELPEPGAWEAMPWPQAVAEVRAALADAVQARLLADVPVGVLLSGGLDSSLVSALAQRQREDRLHSFAVGVAGSDDLRFASEVAEQLGTEHHAFAYTADDVRAALPEVVHALESFDPALVRSAVPTYFVARLAREHVKVVLTGEGADELFAGYDYLEGLQGLALEHELATITRNLHWTNLQRADRLSMVHGLEARVPFLDTRLVELAFRLPWRYKRPPAGPGKHVLREAARGLLPDAVIDRAKAKFSHGTGTADVLRAYAEEAVSDADFRRARRTDGTPFTSKEEVLYHRLFREVLPAAAEPLTGRTRSVVPGEVERNRSG